MNLVIDITLNLKKIKVTWMKKASLESNERANWEAARWYGRLRKTDWSIIT